MYVLVSPPTTSSDVHESTDEVFDGMVVSWSVQATVDPNEVLLYIGWHQKVIKRALDLLPPSSASKQVAAFFHKKVPHLQPSCLLDQVVTHTLAGISAATRRTATGLKLPFSVAGGAPEGGRGRLPPATLAAAAAAAMEEGPRQTLVAVAHTEAVVASVQRHFSSNVAPQVLQVCSMLTWHARVQLAARSAQPTPRFFRVVLCASTVDLQTSDYISQLTEPYTAMSTAGQFECAYIAARSRACADGLSSRAGEYKLAVSWPSYPRSWCSAHPWQSRWLHAWPVV
jgi:hypothetical protein